MYHLFVCLLVYKEAANHQESKVWVMNVYGTSIVLKFILWLTCILNMCVYVHLWSVLMLTDVNDDKEGNENMHN